MNRHSVSREIRRQQDLIAEVHPPVYLRIANEIRQSIRDGVYTVGQRIPTEEQLSIQFGVNRHTLRRAVGLLSTEGLLRVDQGRGTFVADNPIQYPLGERVRFNESLKAQGLEPSYRVLRIVDLPASRRVAEMLELSPGEQVAALDRLGLANGRPIKVASSFFPLRLFPDIAARLAEIASISALFLNVYQCDHLRKRTLITAQPVSPEDARCLEMPLNRPILQLEAVNTDQRGRPIEYGVTRFRGDRMELIIEAES